MPNATHLGCKRVVQQRRRHIGRDEPAGRGHKQSGWGKPHVQSCRGTSAAGTNEHYLSCTVTKHIPT